MIRSRAQTGRSPARRGSRVAALAALALGLTGAAVSAQTVWQPTSAAAAPSCSGGYVALTFDDGPTSATTSQLISILRDNDAVATVFPTGQNIQNDPAGLRAYDAAGLVVGNHSWDHPHLTSMSSDQMRSQLSRTQQIIQQTIGETPNLFRPPYGETNGTLRSIESSLGLTEVLWSVDTQDYNNIPASQIRQRAAAVQSGGVILMHDWPAGTLQALPGIISDLRARNLCPGVVSPSTGRAVAPPTSTPPPTEPPPTTPPPTTPPPTTPPPTEPPPTTPPPTEPPPTEPPPTDPPPGATCSASLAVANSWPGGFQATVTVTAGASGLDGWRVTLPLPSGTSIAQSWSAQVSGANPYTATNVGYNGSVPAGQSTSFGFIGNGSAPSAASLACG